MVASGISAAEYARYFDTVSFCLSKGLGAPVGSLIVSTQDNIDKLRRLRKMFGGGMRQAGILAAAGLYALEHNIARLKNDHDNAKHLALQLQQFPTVFVDPDRVETNIVVFEVVQSERSTPELLQAFKEATTALNSRAPSKWQANPTSLAQEVRSLIVPMEYTAPPPTLWVCSRHRSVVGGLCTSFGRKAA